MAAPPRPAAVTRASGVNICALGAGIISGVSSQPGLMTHPGGVEAFWGQQSWSTALVSGDKAAPSPPCPWPVTKSPLM